MLKFADCNIAVGQPNAISGWRIYDSAQIACQAQRCGIQKGLAFCNAALDLHPLDGNAEMCLICRSLFICLCGWCCQIILANFGTWTSWSAA